MFKLKKILNKHNNAPEVEKMSLQYDTIGEKECIYYVYYGDLTPYKDESEKRHIYYIIYGDVDIGDYGSRTVDCVRITPDMLFEVKYSGSYPQIGNRFALTKSFESSGFDGIRIISGSDDYSDGYIVDNSDFQKNGRVLIRFHCID